MLPSGICSVALIVDHPSSASVPTQGTPLTGRSGRMLAIRSRRAAALLSIGALGAGTAVAATPAQAQLLGGLLPNIGSIVTGTGQTLGGLVDGLLPGVGGVVTGVTGTVGGVVTGV